MAKKMLRNKMEKILKEAKKPLTTSEVLARLHASGYRYTPSAIAASQVLSRDKRFVKVGYLRTDVSKGITWGLKEDNP